MTSKFVSRSVARLLVAAALLLTATACPRREKPLTATGPLLERLEEQATRVKAVRADAKVSLEVPAGTAAPAGSSKFKALVIAAENSRLRMEIISPLGIPALILALDGETVTALAPLSGDYIETSVDDPALSRGLGTIPIPLTRVADFARGVVPLLEGKRTEEKDEAGAPVLVIRDEEGLDVQRIVFNGEGGWPGAVTYFSDDASGERTAGLEIRLSGYESHGDGEAKAVLPAVMKVDNRGGGTAEMELSGVEINPDLAAGVFRLDAPPGRKSPQE